jgi:hypothetical protein
MHGYHGYYLGLDILVEANNLHLELANSYAPVCPKGVLQHVIHGFRGVLEELDNWSRDPKAFIYLYIAIQCSRVNICGHNVVMGGS